jgi:hypothetical protein
MEKFFTFFLPPEIDSSGRQKLPGFVAYIFQAWQAMSDRLYL